MMAYHVDDLVITIGKPGAREYTKVSYPIRYGTYDEIRTKDFVFQFSLSGEIRYIQGRSEDWPSPAEWLKRSQGNDWIYYSAGDYAGIVERFGEYYYPCLSYPSNSITADRPFRYKGVQRALSAAEDLLREVSQVGSPRHPIEVAQFLDRVAAQDGARLRRRAGRFHRLIGGPVTVLPPDARHADYDVIPLVLADGCLYNCAFCSVKSDKGPVGRSRANVGAQIAGLRRFYGPELRNYNALFLGQHDALLAGAEMIEWAVEAAYDSLGLAHSVMRKPSLFLFGSADSFLGAKERLFRSLNGMPFFTYINVGLESPDEATLKILGKPISVGKVRDAYSRMFDINRDYERIEVSANFVMGLHLPPAHLDSLIGLSKEGRPPCGKGTLYVSPIVADDRTGPSEKRALLAQFNRVKRESTLPAFLYLIQRL